MGSVRMSPSDLETYRYFLAGDFMSLEDCIAQLRRELPPNELMLAGTAFHEILEHSGNETLDVAYQDGFEFRFTLDAEVTLPPIRELKAEYAMNVAGQDVVLACVTDVLDGKTCYDHKLAGDFNPEKYVDSLQWRCYLRVFDCDRFTYNVFTRKQKTDKETGQEFWEVTDFNQFTCYRYPGMDADIDRAIHDFLLFAEIHLPERFS